MDRGPSVAPAVDGRRRRRTAGLLALAICILSLTCATANAQAETLYAYANGASASPLCPLTTNTAEQCSLGRALSAAAAGDTVKLETPGASAGGVNYIGTWSVGTPGTSSGSPVTIDGSGISDATLDGNGGSFSGCSTSTCAGPVLTVGDMFLAIKDLTITNGSNEGPGGAGLDSRAGGTVTITGSAFTDNASGTNGGAIDNGDSESGANMNASGTVTVSDSTFSGNTAVDGGGAIDNADGALGTITVTDSTFSGNNADDDGGAIDSSDNGGSGTVTVSDSTLAGDFAIDGAEIDTSDNGGTGTLALSSSTLFGGGGGGFDVTAGRNSGIGDVFVAGDVFATSCQQNGGTWTDAGYNAGADTSCFGAAVPSDVNAGSAVALHIGSLVPNGGPTDTILLAPNSPAADLIPNPTEVTLNGVQIPLCPGTDQRGDARPGDGKPKCDAGAYETQPAKPTVQITTPPAGATYTMGATVNAAYSCAEGTGGPGLVSGATACVGTVADGSPVDTSTPGSHAFTVTATSLDGLTTTVTVPYTVPFTRPVNTARPQISGTAKAGQKLTCSTGTWTNVPKSYTYQWSRDGTPLEGATSAAYTVQELDEGNMLTCSVTASNPAGSGAPAASAGVTIPVPHVARCPAATGSLSGTTLGPLKLGMTKAQAQRADRQSSSRGKAYQEFFCLTPRGVRVGYASPKEISSLPKSERGRYAGRVIWISTSSAFYAIDGVRVGATVQAARKRLRLEHVFVIGANDWYLAPAGSATAVLKVRDDVVQEIGIGVKALNTTRRAQRRFLTSFD